MMVVSNLILNVKLVDKTAFSKLFSKDDVIKFQPSNNLMVEFHTTAHNQVHKIEVDSIPVNGSKQSDFQCEISLSTFSKEDNL